MEILKPDLVDTIQLISKKENIQPSRLIVEYCDIYREIESKANDCYGMMKSIHKSNVINCMDCIGYKAINHMINKYEV